MIAARHPINLAQLLAGQLMPLRIQGGDLNALARLGFEFGDMPIGPDSTTECVFIETIPKGWTVESDLLTDKVCFYDSQGRERIVLSNRDGESPIAYVTPRFVGRVDVNIESGYECKTLSLSDIAENCGVQSIKLARIMPFAVLFTFKACNDPKILETLKALRRIHRKIDNEARILPGILSLAIEAALSRVITQPDVLDPFDIVVPNSAYAAFRCVANAKTSPVRRQIGVLNQKIEKLEARLPVNWAESLRFGSQP